MALYMKIPKDMNEIRDTVMLKMTKRQLIYNAIGLSLGLSVFWLTYKSLGTSTSSIFLLCLGCPFFIMGGYIKNGFPLEKIIVNFIRYNLCPKFRPYKTENIYRKIAEEIEYKEEVEMLETGRKKVKLKN